MQYELLISGEFQSNDIDIVYEEKKLERSQQEKKFIDEKWNEAKKNSKLVYDGKLFRVEEHSKKKSSIFLRVTDSSYKEYVGTRNKDYLNNFGVSSTANPLSAGCVVITSDNKLVFGVRNTKTDTESSKITVVSGWVDEKDLERQKIDVFNCIRRELAEEMNIKSKIRRISCIGLIYNKIYNQTFMPFYVTIDMKFDELNSKFKPDEFSSIFSIPNTEKDIKKLLESKNLADIVTPTMKLFSIL